MNRNLNEPLEGRGNLNGFYSYKNTFDKDSVWLDVPKDGMALKEHIVIWRSAHMLCSRIRRQLRSICRRPGDFVERAKQNCTSKFSTSQMG